MKPALLFFSLLMFLSITCRKKTLFTSAAQLHMIAIQPLNEFNTIEIDSAIIEISHRMNARVIVLKSVNLPESFINPITKKYSADSIIHLLSEIKNDSISEVIGLINQPIFTIRDTKPEPFYDEKIFGLGYQPGTACVISDYRFRTMNTAIYQQRLKNVILHEVGHNLGLAHCNNPKCLMSESNGYFKQLDSSNTDYCAKCKRQIRL